MRYARDWIRVLLSIILLYFTWGETGPITTLCIFLTMARAEAQDFNKGLTFTDKQRR